MDYPELSLLFGWALIFMGVLNIALRVLLTKVRLSVWLSSMNWVALLLGILSALYVEYLFLQRMLPSFNRQITFGWLVIGGLGALLTARLYPKEISPRMSGFMLIVQVFTGFFGVVLRYGLHRSLVPI